ncbi:hypothetical protein N7462_008412 [Penicillium macrosclerotiorum]|uniref:uncharacterized protein n=1 Tax=Penicillium macrosclerotiorum TaxID=303699 RepID=UPI002548E2A0|nr:uncharacterized protein N7462_008412 [Penicillium macrosclerotiorum]KAJ5675515.1 hypothetical protein N7462_008412 [Penicillium macrosclerotiorum]
MVTGIHNQLASWESQLPHKLRLETYRGKDTSQPLLLRMQALLLQLSYDNVLIFLHRSAAFGISSKGSSEYHSAPILSGSAFSQQQLLNSALRTSELYQYRALLQACRRTHAAMHIGICLFTAGVILCTFALSRPLSSSAEKAKAGVANILRLHQNSVLGEHLLSTQSAKVLTDLVAAVMRSEQKFILGQQDKNNSTSTQSATEYTTISTIEKSVTPYTPAPTEDQSPTLLVSQATTPNNHHDSFTPETDRAPIELFEELLSADSIAELIWDGDMPTFTDPNLPDTSSFWP